MNSHDYFMRQIEEMAQFIAKTFFHKITEEVPLFDEQGNPLASGILYGTLKALIENGKINEAENMLFDKIHEQKKADRELYLEVAVKFYAQLNELSNDRLLECGFTREEILEGLSEVKQICEGN